MSENQPTSRQATSRDEGEIGAPATPKLAVVASPEDDGPTTYEASRAGPDPTVGTGSIFAVGCVVLLLVGVAVLAAIYFLPFVSR